MPETLAFSREREERDLAWEKAITHARRISVGAQERLRGRFGKRDIQVDESTKIILNIVLIIQVEA